MAGVLRLKVPGPGVPVPRPGPVAVLSGYASGGFETWPNEKNGCRPGIVKGGSGSVKDQNQKSGGALPKKNVVLGVLPGSDPVRPRLLYGGGA